VRAALLAMNFMDVSARSVRILEIDQFTIE